MSVTRHCGKVSVPLVRKRGRPLISELTHRGGFVALLAGSALLTPAVSLAQTAMHSAAALFTTGYRYDAVRQLVGQIDASPATPSAPSSLPYPAVRNTYDGLRRIIRIEKGTLSAWQDETIAPANWTGFTALETTNISYDPDSNKIDVRVTGSDGSLQSLTQMSYDANDRSLCSAVRLNLGSAPVAGTDGCTLTTAASFGPDRISKTIYDGSGRTIQLWRATGTPQEEAYETYAYSSNDKQTDVVDANGNHTQYTYDGFDRQIVWTFPSPTPPSSYAPGAASGASASTVASAISSAGAANSADFEQYAYDSNSNRTQLQKRDGSVINYTYDALNRNTSKIVPQRTGLPATDARSVYYSYDLLGRQLTAQFDRAGGEGIINTYDSVSRQLSTALTMDGATRTVSYQYDPDGNRITVGLPGGNTATYGYDGLQRPLAITTSVGTTPASYAYNADGTRASFKSNSTAINTGYTYDPIDRLSGLTNTPLSSSCEASRVFRRHLLVRRRCYHEQDNEQVFT
jgi:YD repeat-containing protein